MPELPPPIPSIVDLIFERYVRDREDWRRPLLGISILGRECARERWMTFRWCSEPEHDGQRLRLFARGDREEDWLLEELERLGIEVARVDEDAGIEMARNASGRLEAKQPQIRVMLAPHIGGSVDGLACGIPEAPDEWVLVECKTHSSASFRDLVKKGCRESKPEHWFQIQGYLHGLRARPIGIRRALYLAVCKDDDRIHRELIDYDEEAADLLVERARMIVESPEPLSRISDAPSFYRCQKLCDHYEPCQLRRVARIARNCRTCADSSPESSGYWVCRRHEKFLTIGEQKAGCDDYRVIEGITR